MSDNINDDNFYNEPITIYHKLYSKLEAITSGLDSFLRDKEYLKLESRGFMDLIIEKIDKDTISIAHYYKQNSDLIADIDITAKIDINNKTAEVLSYQDCFKYNQIYHDDGTTNEKLKKDINNFFLKWLEILKQQGFYK